MRRVLLATVLLVVEAGCASSRVELKTPFDPQEYATCPGRGTNVIAGSTFGKTAGGDVVSAAGGVVHLDKSTKYLHSAFLEVRKKQAKDGFFEAQRESDTVALDPKMLKCRRNTTVGLDSSFMFDDVAPGPYFVSTYISKMNKAGRWSGVWNVSAIVVRDGDSILPVVLNGFHYPEPRGKK